MKVGYYLVDAVHGKTEIWTVGHYELEMVNAKALVMAPQTPANAEIEG